MSVNNRLKVIHLNHNDLFGGAARACNRLHRSLLETGLESTLCVNIKHTTDPTVYSPYSRLHLIPSLRLQLSKPLRACMKPSMPSVTISPAMLPSRWPRLLNNSDADIVHLHWVQGEMLSVEDIAQIKKPLFWTLHDMWPFCGAEHTAFDYRWAQGYNKSNRSGEEVGLDLNMYVWKRKLNLFKHPIHMVAPSAWMASCAKKSFLMKTWPVSTIPNPIDTKFWRPIDSRQASFELGFDRVKYKYLLYAGFHSGSSFVKGADLFLAYIDAFREFLLQAQVKLIILGKCDRPLPYPEHMTHIAGEVSDDHLMRIYYSVADVTMITSRQESFGQVAAESQSCGTPVVSFDIGGLSDIIKHTITGYLSHPFDILCLHEGVRYVLANSHRILSPTDMHILTERNFGMSIVANRVAKMYEQSLKCPMTLRP